MRKVSRSSDVKRLELTIYCDGYGSICEMRTLDGIEGYEELEYLDVPKLIEPDSLVVKGAEVSEYRFLFDLSSREKLIGRYRGRTVQLKNRDSYSVKLVRVLDLSGMPVFQDVETGDMYIDSHDELILPPHPDGIQTVPAIVMKIKGAGNEITATYLTRGLSFTMTYVAEMDDHRLNLTGWAGITNESGRSFHDAAVSLMAGDVSKTYGRPEMMYMAKSVMADTMGMAEEKPFSGYHLYTVPSNADLLDGETRQVKLIEGKALPYTRHYLTGNQVDGAQIVITLMNAEESGLGIPLPGGKVKLFKLDGHITRFTGEASIGHIPQGGKVELLPGKAFDISSEGIEASRHQRSGIDHVRWEAKITNHGKEAANVHYEYHIYEKFEIKSSSHTYEMKDSGTLLFRVPLEPGEEAHINCEYASDKRVHIEER